MRADREEHPERVRGPDGRVRMLGRIPWPLVPVPWRTGPGLRFDLPGFAPAHPRNSYGGREVWTAPASPACAGPESGRLASSASITAVCVRIATPIVDYGRDSPVLSPVTTASRICPAAAMSSCPVAASRILGVTAVHGGGAHVCRPVGPKSRSAGTSSEPHPNGRSVAPVCANTHRSAVCAATVHMMVSRAARRL